MGARLKVTQLSKTAQTVIVVVNGHLSAHADAGDCNRYFSARVQAVGDVKARATRLDLVLPGRSRRYCDCAAENSGPATLATSKAPPALPVYKKSRSRLRNKSSDGRCGDFVRSATRISADSRGLGVVGLQETSVDQIIDHVDHGAILRLGRLRKAVLGRIIPNFCGVKTSESRHRFVPRPGRYLLDYGVASRAIICR